MLNQPRRRKTSSSINLKMGVSKPEQEQIRPKENAHQAYHAYHAYLSHPFYQGVPSSSPSPGGYRLDRLPSSTLGPTLQQFGPRLTQETPKDVHGRGHLLQWGSGPWGLSLKCMKHFLACRHFVKLFEMNG
jgi:hypothetical protein